MTRVVLLVSASLTLAGCVTGPSSFPEPLAVYPAPNADQYAKLLAAWGRLCEAPHELDRIIWYGRRTAYLGAYERAIAIYTAGLERHPGSPFLLRHRGHRYITTGRFADAVTDLSSASRAIEGTDDVVEPDGLPNARNIPTSTLHTNVWYHLGLAHYVLGDFGSARSSFTQCLLKSRNRDMEAAARYWLYLSTRRAGVGDGRDVLEPVAADWDIIENTSYHRLLLLFRGDLSFEQVSQRGDDAIQSATLEYGLARYELEHRVAADGWARIARLARSGAPAAFGAIAARVDLARQPDDER